MKRGLTTEPVRKVPPRAREMQGRPVVPDSPSTNEPHPRPPARPLSAALNEAVARQGPENAARVREFVKRKASAP